PPQIYPERAEEILQRYGRLDECQVEVLDEEKARKVLEELFRHGALTKDELPYLYIKPTEALVVRETEEVARERPRVARRLRRAA
ncbi:MAG TPA: hypothetical protein VHS28_10895, partial [Chloroflexota bacterium]|nr:hypothetical protein [Chloroflexota bacterium]